MSDIKTLNPKTHLRFFLWLALLDVVGIWLLIVFYLTKINLVFLVNLNFFVIFTYLFLVFLIKPRMGFLQYVFCGVLIISIVKLLTGFFYGANVDITHTLTHFFGILMPLATLSFASNFERSSVTEIDNEIFTYAKRYCYIAVIGIIVYAFFYFTGAINYFGLGAKFHYVVPFLLGTTRATLFFLIIILISGKRATLLNFLAQVAVFYSGFLKRQPLLLIIMAAFFIVGLVFLYEHTDFLRRFKALIEFDISDPNFFTLAFGGRFEEVQGVYEYFSKAPYQIWFGAPPGEFYHWIVESSDLKVTKNYAHVTFVGYFFRYGALFTIGIYIAFVFYILKHWSSRDPYFIVFVGIVFGSTFGANLVIDPVSWFFIGLLLARSKAKRNENMNI